MSTIKRFVAAPTRFQNVGDSHIVDRAIGVPVIFLNHLGTVLGNFDLRIVGSLATILTGEPS